MILEHGIVLSAAQARDNDEYYAMVGFRHERHNLAIASSNAR